MRNSIQYAQSLIAIYSLVPGENQRRPIHQTYMKVLKGHLNSVRKRQIAFVKKLEIIVNAVAGVDSQSFLAPALQVLRDRVFDSGTNALVNGANLEHTIGLLADELVAPGLDYSSHPDALPSVPDARKRISMREILRRAAERPLMYLNASDRSRATIAVQKWLAILIRKRSEQEGIVASGSDDMGVDDAASSSSGSTDSLLRHIPMPGQF